MKAPDLVSAVRNSKGRMIVEIVEALSGKAVPAKVRTMYLGPGLPDVQAVVGRLRPLLRSAAS